MNLRCWSYLKSFATQLHKNNSSFVRTIIIFYFNTKRKASYIIYYLAVLSITSYLFSWGSLSCSDGCKYMNPRSNALWMPPPLLADMPTSSIVLGTNHIVGWYHELLLQNTILEWGCEWFLGKTWFDGECVWIVVFFSFSSRFSLFSWNDYVVTVIFTLLNHAHFSVSHRIGNSTLITKNFGNLNFVHIKFGGWRTISDVLILEKSTFAGIKNVQNFW